MEQKIDLEIRLRELAAQSMLEAQDEIDVLEVEKSLLTSDQRMNCYASLLEEQRKQLSNPSLSTADSGRGSKSGKSHRSPTHRPDVIGANGTVVNQATTTGVASSPSFTSSASPNSQSPSKLSPVSGESANSPSFTTNTTTTANSSQHSRQLGLRSQSSAHNNATLCARQRAKNKQRERLMQSITSMSNINCNMAISNRASVSISEIRIPLMWRDVDHFKNRGDYKRFAIFCLLKIDSQIYDTQLICDVDRQMTDVTFDDLVVFNEIDHNFELTLEVYTCVYLEHFSLSSTPRKLKEKLTSSVSRAMGRRLAGQTASTHYTKELQAYDKSYRFAMIANATLRLSDASDSVKTYDLVLATPSAHHRHHQGSTTSHRPDQSAEGGQSSNGKDVDKNTLPLFGHFCCKLLVRPDVFDKNIKTGYLRVATISVPNNNNNNTISSTQNSHSGSSDRVSDSPQNSTAALDVIADSAASKLRSTLAAASSKMATLSMSTSRVHWGLLRNFALHLWPIDDEDLELALQRGELPLLENPHKPRLTLSIDKYARLLRVSNSSLTIETDKGCFVLGVYSPETTLYGTLNQADEISHWLRSIEQLIYDSHIWGSVLSHYPPHTKSSTSTRWSGGGNNNNNNKRTTSNKQKHHYAGAGVIHADL